jgi:hypothetical protein
MTDGFPSASSPASTADSICAVERSRIQALVGRMAVVRYRATLELDLGDGRGTPFECWHTDSYELTGDAWQVVWSQATAIR